MAESNVELSPETISNCKAKIRCLDIFFADNNKDSFGGDFNFIADMKDWIDRHKRKITKRQCWRVDQIWNHITDNYDLDFKDFMDKT